MFACVADYLFKQEKGRNTGEVGKHACNDLEWKRSCNYVVFVRATRIIRSVMHCGEIWPSTSWNFQGLSGPNENEDWGSPLSTNRGSVSIGCVRHSWALPPSKWLASPCSITTRTARGSDQSIQTAHVKRVAFDWSTGFLFFVRCWRCWLWFGWTCWSGHKRTIRLILTGILPTASGSQFTIA